MTALIHTLALYVSLLFQCSDWGTQWILLRLPSGPCNSLTVCSACAWPQPTSAAPSTSSATTCSGLETWASSVKSTKNDGAWIPRASTSCRWFWIWPETFTPSCSWWSRGGETNTSGRSWIGISRKIQKWLTLWFPSWTLSSFCCCIVSGRTLRSPPTRSRTCVISSFPWISWGSTRRMQGWWDSVVSSPHWLGSWLLFSHS